VNNVLGQIMLARRIGMQLCPPVLAFLILWWSPRLA